MKNFQDTFEARQQSFIIAFSICMTVHLIVANFDRGYVKLKSFIYILYNYYTLMYIL